MDLLDKAIQQAKLSVSKPVQKNTQQKKETTSSGSENVSVASWNLSGSLDGFTIDRFEHALKTLTSAPVSADIICLQEVPLDHLGWMINRFKVLDYNVFHSITKTRVLGEMTAIRFPIKSYEFVPFVSEHGRPTDFGMNFVEFECYGRSCLIVNTQLDSSFECKDRREQFDDLISLVRKMDKFVIIAMDSNFKTHEPEPWLPPKWVDSWDQYGVLCDKNKNRKYERCYTLDGSRNPTILNTYGNVRHRPDRVLYFNGDRKFRWSLKSFGLLGTKEFKMINGHPVFVSEHFGVYNKYTIEEMHYLPKTTIVVS
uniref:5'-tyrosyl DNA phosphodiesterase n=1 Tax=Clandestinovirus TaxID=2831644 RepID=A0A8F8KLY2_9VIRU|nr:5'-tyrosyl DNA phosphodiesterase [Clandestinovirus]